MMESQGGSGGVVVCLGVGGMVDLGPLLGLENEGDESPYSAVEVWVIDSHRPWNLGNVFGGFPLEPAVEEGSSYQTRCPGGVEGGQVSRSYRPGRGGIVVFDDGDVEQDLTTERQAYLALLDMPDIDDNNEDLGSSDDDGEDAANDRNELRTTERGGKKRKSWSARGDEDSDEDDDRPRQRRRSNSVRPKPCQGVI